MVDLQTNRQHDRPLMVLSNNAFNSYEKNILKNRKIVFSDTVVLSLELSALSFQL